MSFLRISLLVFILLLFIGLYFYQIKMDEIEKKIEALADMQHSCERKLENLKFNFSENLETLNFEIDVLEGKVRNLEAKVQEGKISYPTYEELIRFIAQDKTDQLEYVEGKFVCTDFANTFIENFRKKGFYSCMTILEIYDVRKNKEGAHALVQVYTKDRGIVYVEPQNDYTFTDLKVGENYCNKVNWDCNFQIKAVKGCFR